MEVVEKSVLIFKALGDLTRLRIVDVICNEAKSVTTIANELEMTQSAISHQLKILKTYDIVKSLRKGKEVYYGLSDSHIQEIIQQVYSHASHK